MCSPGRGRQGLSVSGRARRMGSRGPQGPQGPRRRRHPGPPTLFAVVHVVALVAGLVHAAKEVPVTHVAAVAGMPVLMPCEIGHDPGDSVTLVLWYSEELGRPIYSVDNREGFKNSKRWSDPQVFGARADFKPEKVPAELAIDAVREADAGVYRCRVDFHVAQTRNTRINLTVTVPPRQVTILDENGDERTTVVGPFREGQRLHLQCHVYGGKPPPTVRWLRNDRPVREGVTVTKGDTNSDEESHIQTTIEIGHLHRRDLHSQLTCSAHNNNRTTPLTTTVHVDMNFPPLDIHMMLAEKASLSARTRYDIVCQSSGSRPPALITWWKDGHRMTGTKETTSTDANTTTSTLSYQPAKEDAGKTLTCKAFNRAMEGAVLEESRELHIQYVPETKLVLGKSLNPDNIREGSDVYYDCLVDANPPTHKVEWRHNGRLLHHNISGGVIIAKESLVLQGVSRASAGNYTCVGFNQEGEGVSNSFYLNVMFAPTCEPNQTRVHGVAKQEKANISCAVDANPGDVEFRWTFNNSAESVDVEGTHITRHGTVSTVSYTPMTELDYGTLLCYAKNRIGSQRVPCVYHIIAAGRPDSVINCSVANTSMTSFSVRCFEGFNGGLPQSFLLEVRDPVSQELRSNVSSASPAFQVDRLEPGASYQACVFSVNGKGRSDPVILQASTIRPAEKQLHPDKGEPRSAFRLTPLTSTLVGGVCALFLIAAVVCVSVRARCCADKRRARKEAHEDDKGSIPGAGSPHSAKFGDSSGGDGTTDSDEKNPDIIPQSGTTSAADSDDHSDLIRRRQHVSTIETTDMTSPSRTLLQGVQQGYPGYCTLRNGMPLQDLGGHMAQPKPKMKAVEMTAYSGGAAGCPTLPRHGAGGQHWSSYGVRHPMLQGYPAPGAVPGGPSPGPGPGPGHGPGHGHAGTMLLRHPQTTYMGLSSGPGHGGLGLGLHGPGHGPGHTQTLPRHHGGAHGRGHGLHHAAMPHPLQMQALANNAHLQQPAPAQQHHGPSSDEDQAGVDTPLMVSKRESTV